MITEDYVSFEVAKLLKEKGFDEPTFTYYNNVGNLMTSYDFCGDYISGRFNNMKNEKVNCAAPTLQMTMKYLREIHNKHIYAVPVVTDDDGVMGYWWEDCIITNRQYNSIRTGKLYNSPEKAYEAAIKYCLTNLI